MSTEKIECPIEGCYLQFKMAARVKAHVIVSHHKITDVHEDEWCTMKKAGFTWTEVPASSIPNAQAFLNHRSKSTKLTEAEEGENYSDMEQNEAAEEKVCLRKKTQSMKISGVQKKQ